MKILFRRALYVCHACGRVQLVNRKEVEQAQRDFSA